MVGRRNANYIEQRFESKKHKDANKEHSWILWLGDFTGGALNFEDGTKLEEKYKWHKINGQIPHWNDEHEGTKYAVVLYRSTRTPKSTRLNQAKARKKLERQQQANPDAT